MRIIIADIIRYSYPSLKKFYIIYKILHSFNIQANCSNNSTIMFLLLYITANTRVILFIHYSLLLLLTAHIKNACKATNHSLQNYYPRRWLTNSFRNIGPKMP
ncbi:hypothetical protein PanWU01x14_296140 [Parasponia andersonii]|uniref:Uncharacterized protein n=1 Tax=Parasponia andersonii TaxID=3476 RepID=A0A2P5AVL5_PARAD|nr:hypothetical protein PanWU01x14_296140 [Parasponia andersonii]